MKEMITQKKSGKDIKDINTLKESLKNKKSVEKII
jgi:hypothetical protein